MRKGTVIKPYWGFEVGETIYIMETNLTFKPSINIYKTEELSSFVVTTWDMEMLNECVKFEQPLNNDFNNGLEEMNMSIYCVRMFSDDGIDMVVGYATTEEKAKQMIEIMENTDGFDLYEYEYYPVFTDTLNINNEIITV